MILHKSLLHTLLTAKYWFCIQHRLSANERSILCDFYTCHHIHLFSSFSSHHAPSFANRLVTSYPIYGIKIIFVSVRNLFVSNGEINSTWRRTSLSSALAAKLSFAPAAETLGLFTWLNYCFCLYGSAALDFHLLILQTAAVSSSVRQKQYLFGISHTVSCCLGQEKIAL